MKKLVTLLAIAGVSLATSAFADNANDVLQTIPGSNAEVSNLVMADASSSEKAMKEKETHKAAEHHGEKHAKKHHHHGHHKHHGKHHKKPHHHKMHQE